LASDVAIEIGSGSQGRSYLVNRDGYLFQSPISWFTDTHSWGLSPGFGEVTLHFRRNITVQCLFCHINQFTPVANTAYRYVQPLPQQLTIGCERCHGPGQLHVARREAAETVEGTDDSIVNPADLEPTLREAVCQQCHLMGEQRIVRRKRSVFDYRPGLPLYLVFSTFVRPPQAVESGKFLSHVEQMYLSKCFRATSGPGKLGCISCHDPHCKPAPADRIAFYRSRCLNCHRILEDGGVVSGRLVSGKEANDRKLQLTTSHFTQPHHSPLTTHHSPEDDCISCHMPRRSSTSLAHAAVSDHRIIRWPGRDPELGPESRSVVQPAQIPLLYFHRDLRDPADPDVRRDLGLAMISKSRSETHLEIRHAICARAMPLLETALQDDPEDIDALEAKGFGLWVLDAPRQALATLEAVLAKVPAREIAREDAAQLATSLGLEQTAIDHWRQLLTANPWNPEAHYSLAKLLGQRQDWLGAITETSAALRFDPTNVAARMLLVAACLKTGDQKRAHQEFATVERLQPPQLDKLREWFTAQERP